MKKALKILAIVIVGLIIILAILVLCINVFRRAIYPKYYAAKTDLVGNAGLGEGYVPQDLTSFTYEDKVVYLTCGYMTKNRPSRIYVMWSGKEPVYFVVKDDNGNSIKDRFEGIAIYDSYILVVSSAKLYLLPLNTIITSLTTQSTPQPSEAVLNSIPNNEISIECTINLGVEGNFLFAYDNGTTNLLDDVLFVGEYVEESKSGTLVNDGSQTYSARVRCYSLIDIVLGRLNLVSTYLVRDQVEGMAIAEDKIVLVTANGLFPSHYYIYEIPDSYDDGLTYFLDDRYLQEEIKGPVMASGLDYDGKQFISMFQSASNEYIIGKFFFANQIVGLDF